MGTKEKTPIQQPIKHDNPKLKLDRRGEPTRRSTREIARVLAHIFVAEMPKYQTKAGKETNKEKENDLIKLFYGGGTFGIPGSTNSFAFNVANILMSPGGSIPMKISGLPIRTRRIKELATKIKMALAKYIPGGIRSSKEDSQKPGLTVTISRKGNMLYITIHKEPPKIQKIGYIVPTKKKPKLDKL